MMSTVAMQDDPLTPEQARELAGPRKWTVEDLLGNLPHVHPWWVRDALPHFGGDRAELESKLVALMARQAAELPRIYMGLVLFFLGHPAGHAAFFAGLRSSEPKVRALVLDQLRIFGMNDLGREGSSGTLGLGLAEVCAGIAPFLREPGSNEGSVALEYMLRWPAFEASIEYTRPLLTHPDAAVRERVVQAYLEHGRDDGATALLASELLEPWLSAAQKTDAWRQARREDCRALNECASRGKSAAAKAQAAAVAMQIVREALAAPDMAARFDGDGAWLDSNELLQAIAAGNPEGAAALLREIVATAAAPTALRTHAALRHFDLTGGTAPGSEAAVRDMVQRDLRGLLDARLEQFVEREMAGLDTLIAAAHNTSWCYEATKLLGKWPSGTDDQIIVDGLMAPMETFARAMPGTEQSLKYVLDVLRGRALRSADRERIVAALRTALARARVAHEEPWIARCVLHQLVMFGDLAAAGEPGADAWDVTLAHWQRNAWTWRDVAAMLEALGVMDALQTIPEYVERSDDPASSLVGLMYECGQRGVFVKLQDDGYEWKHHEIFGNLAAAARPPVEVEALSETADFQMNEVGTADDMLATPIYSTEGTTSLVRFVHAGRVYRFVTRPGGSWTDIWAVIDAFNRFMAQIGRPERAYRIGSRDTWDGFWALLVCADEQRFGEINARLRLPLYPRPEPPPTAEP